MSDDVGDLALPALRCFEPFGEGWGNDVPTVLGQRCDAFLFFDDTTALRPLHLEPEGSAEQDTWPYAV